MRYIKFILIIISAYPVLSIGAASELTKQKRLVEEAPGTVELFKKFEKIVHTIPGERDLSTTALFDLLLKNNRGLINERHPDLGYALLQHAIRFKENEVAQRMINYYGADPNALTAAGEDSIQFAANYGNQEMVNVLKNIMLKKALEYRKSFEVLFDMLETSFHHPDRKRAHAFYELLCEHKDAINEIHPDFGTTILHSAIFFGAYDDAKVMVELFGADPRIQTVKGLDAVAFASVSNQHGMIPFLIRKIVEKESAQEGKYDEKKKMHMISGFHQRMVSHMHFSLQDKDGEFKVASINPEKVFILDGGPEDKSRIMQVLEGKKPLYSFERGTLNPNDGIKLVEYTVKREDPSEAYSALHYAGTDPVDVSFEDNVEKLLAVANTPNLCSCIIDDKAGNPHVHFYDWLNNQSADDYTMLIANRVGGTRACTDLYLFNCYLTSESLHKGASKSAFFLTLLKKINPDEFRMSSWDHTVEGKDEIIVPKTISRECLIKTFNEVVKCLQPFFYIRA